MINWILFGILVILQIVDGWSTWKALTASSGVTEANRMIAWLMEKIGLVPALILIKLIFIGSLVPAIAYAPAEIIIFPLAALTAFYVWVVINNIRRV